MSGLGEKITWGYVLLAQESKLIQPGFTSTRGETISIAHCKGCLAPAKLQVLSLPDIMQRIMSRTPREWSRP